MADPIVTPTEPIKQVVVEIPKTKADWDKLRSDDPIKWGELTQSNADTYYKQSKEAQEKLSAAEQREKNLLAEINRLKQPAPILPVDDNKPKIYGNGVYPQTQEEWNNLAFENPVFFQDLRYEYNNSKKSTQEEYNKARVEGVKTLIAEHPEMYHFEVDSEGKQKLKDGKPIVMIDPNTGLYAFNSESEKGKLWMQIYHDSDVLDSFGRVVGNGLDNNKNAPQLMMAEMERRLRQKGASMVQGQNNQGVTDQSEVAGEGVPPPKSVSLKFGSEEEKAHAQGMVNRGVYKSMEEYVKLRDEENKGYAEPNRRPDFSKR